MQKKYDCKNITTAFSVVVVFFLLFSCNTTVTEQIDLELSSGEVPRLHTADVTTVISDSGITRYRIYTPVWNVYDNTSQPYWEFPDGVHFERFDEDLIVDANVHCEYAKFLEKEKIWELKGNVRATNIKGELFETEQLFWNQKTEKIYSDSLVTITQEDYIINAQGFESNQQMTKYTWKQTQGIFPVEEEEDQN
ncbi:MAG TPA: LPS export ABC transporter periplasmic protein LptC [Paludibacter sp.]|nr:MAG: Lipopolysaccharide-assembly, LptC-related [Bacteroidetes bacterium ADurb.Bin174]HQB27781.1 LPS export ABC transporter periplasmic protein LptC [Paludibacter sp.]